MKIDKRLALKIGGIVVTGIGTVMSFISDKDKPKKENDGGLTKEMVEEIFDQKFNETK